MVYKLSDFPDYPTATVHDCCSPDFNDLKSYSVLMDADLDRYLRSEALQFYVFDYKEEQMDEYVGKTGVSLLPLAQDEGISGEFSQTSCPPSHLQDIQTSPQTHPLWFRASTDSKMTKIQ